MTSAIEVLNSIKEINEHYPDTVSSIVKDVDKYNNALLQATSTVSNLDRSIKLYSSPDNSEDFPGLKAHQLLANLNLMEDMRVALVDLKDSFACLPLSPQLPSNQAKAEAALTLLDHVTEVARSVE